MYLRLNYYYEDFTCCRRKAKLYKSGSSDSRSYSICIFQKIGNMGFSLRLWLFLNTIRYLTPGQILCRLWRVIRIRWRRITGTQAPRPFGWELRHYQSIYAGLSDIGNRGPWQAQAVQALEQAKEVSQQHFCFLQHSHVFHEKILWEDPKLSQLWRYNLHYFEYVNDLLVWSALGNAEKAYHTFKSLANSWIQGNQRLMGDGWHPYTISLRIVNWVNALSAFQLQLSKDKQFFESILSSIYGQGHILAHDIEFDVRGNHIIKNLKALIWLGIAFKGPEPDLWLRKAVRLLELELAEQILPDGGHFERVPGYHLVVLKDCLEIALLLSRNQQKVPYFLEAVLTQMLDFLAGLLPPNGKAPLLKDTAWDTGPRPCDLLSAGAIYLNMNKYKFSDCFGIYPFLLFGKSGWSKFKEWPLCPSPQDSVAFPETGYYVMRDHGSGDYLIFDAGKPCPDYLPAHAHADMLSYELMVGGQRLVVDSGVYKYTAGPWRDFFRSTRAHNTVEVADLDQSEVWGSFRVARRARPGAVIWESKEGYALVQGEHDGYARLATPVIHGRTILWEKKGFWLVVDELIGEGMTRCANRVHFHPLLTLMPLGDSTWQVEGGIIPVWVSAFGEEKHTLVRGQIEPVREGWYSERFGELMPNMVLVLDRGDDLPFCCGYVISKHQPAEVHCTYISKREFRVDVNYMQNHYKLEIGPNGVLYSQ